MRLDVCTGLLCKRPALGLLTEHLCPSLVPARPACRASFAGSLRHSLAGSLPVDCGLGAIPYFLAPKKNCLNN